MWHKFLQKHFSCKNKKKTCSNYHNFKMLFFFSIINNTLSEMVKTIISSRSYIPYFPLLIGLCMKCETLGEYWLFIIIVFIPNCNWFYSLNRFKFKGYDLFWHFDLYKCSRNLLFLFLPFSFSTLPVNLHILEYRIFDLYQKSLFLTKISYFLTVVDKDTWQNIVWISMFENTPRSKNQLSCLQS